MNPYLEHPGLWTDVHDGLAVEIQESLAPRLRPKYFVAIEERSYMWEPGGIDLVGRPDIAIAAPTDPTRASPHGAAPEQTGILVEVPVAEEVHENYLEIREAVTGEVVTSIELLSPTNKLTGEGRTRYEEKRRKVLMHRTHLVEIDLVRQGPPMPFYGGSRIGDYRILISRGDQRPRARLFAFGLREVIPVFQVPLRGGDEEPLLDLGRLLQDRYDKVGYDLRIDYRRDPVPPLSSEDGAWARGLLARAGLRESSSE